MKPSIDISIDLNIINRNNKVIDIVRNRNDNMFMVIRGVGDVLNALMISYIMKDSDMMIMMHMGVIFRMDFVSGFICMIPLSL